MSARFDDALFRELLRNRGLSLGEPLVSRDVTESTNDDALAAARAGAPSGACFVADTQLRGRGRRGSAWLSAPETSVTFSVLLGRRHLAERAPALPLVAGLAVRSAVAKLLPATGPFAQASVKWPNDVLVADRKLAGVLVESRVEGGKVATAVVGVGLNLGLVALPPDVGLKAVSLEECGVHVPREELLVSILGELESRLGALDNDAALPGELLYEIRSHDALLGLRVRVGEISGVASGIDEAGNLLIRPENTSSDVPIPVTGGHVEILGLGPNSALR